MQTGLSSLQILCNYISVKPYFPQGMREICNQMAFIAMKKLCCKLTPKGEFISSQERFLYDYADTVFK